MEVLTYSSIWKFLKWFPSFVVRKIFTKVRMGELILVDVRPRYEYAKIDLGEVPRFELWLQIINMSPFDVELDRAEIIFNYGGMAMKSSVLKKSTLKSGQIEDMFIDENINDGQANHIANHLESTRSEIEVNIEFNCKIHDFSKRTGRLDGVIPVFRNEKMRLATVECLQEA